MAKKARKLLCDKFRLPTQNFEVLNEEFEDTGEVGTVDDKNILARLRGPFFIVNGESLNNRFYSRKLWENCIKTVEPQIAAVGGLFGTVGHSRPIDEDALLDGKISHKVTKLWIDENGVGMGEIAILGTDGGRQLNAVLRGGMKIPVSSRAYGTVSGKTSTGADIIDPDNFVLESFDFVLTPGVETAYPKVVESVAKEVSEMDLQKLLEEKVELQHKLKKANEANQALKNKLAESNKKVERCIKTLKFYVESVGKISDVNAFRESLRKWLELEPLRAWAIKQKLLPNNKSYIPGYGASTAIVIESYSKHGSPADVAEAMDLLKQYKDFGSVKDCNRLYSLCQAYVENGSPASIKEKLEAIKLSENQRKAEARAHVAEQIATALKVKVEDVAEMLKYMPHKAVIARLKSLKESSDLSNRYREGESKKHNVTDIFEAAGKNGKSATSLAARAFSQLR